MLYYLKDVYKKAFWFINHFFLFVSSPPKNLVRKISFVLLPFVVILTLIPIINIATITATAGENNISNDVVFWADLVDKALNHKLSVSEFITRSFISQHFVPLHLAIEMINAYVFDWNIYITLFVGFFLNLIKLVLLFDLFTFRYPQNPFRWLLLPVLSAVVFSNMEVTTFTGQNAATLIGMSLFGVVLSIWGIVRLQPRFQGVVVCIIGGFIATWTFALGLLAWPITLVGMVLLNYRKVKYYLVWLASTLVCIFPYWYFMFFKGGGESKPVPLNIGAIINLPFLLNMMGRPLVDLSTFEFTRQYKIAGAIGFALAFACLVVVAFHLRENKYKIFIPALMMFALGLGGVWLTSIGRNSLASWYITAAWPFWQGIIGFGFLLLMEPASTGPVQFSFLSSLGLLKKVFAAFIFLTVAVLYARSNIGNEVEGFLLYSRTPASAACLRNYQSAPAYCESFLFQWPIQRPDFIFELGRPLGKNQLSANGRQQQWSLQGDFIFNQVEVKRVAQTDPIGWFEGLQGDRTAWAGIKRWHHLDLMLHSPNIIRWTVEFPEYMETAVLKSAVGARNDGKDYPAADGFTFVVRIEGDQAAQKTVFEKLVSKDEQNWLPFSVDLSAYKGKQITIEFTSLPGKNNIADWAMVQYPVIDVKVARHVDTRQNVRYTPENTDEFSGFHNPVVGDLVWDGTDLNVWSLSNLEAVKAQPGFYRGDEDPYFLRKEPFNACLADYAYFYVEFALPKGTQDGDRVAQIFYQLNDGQPFLEERSVRFSAYSDGKVHGYTYPIRLLDLDAGYNARITNIRFDPMVVINPTYGPIQFLKFGLLRGQNQGTSICH